MIENGRKEVQKADKLITTVMAMLNISVLILIGLICWSVYVLFDNSTAIAKFLNGSFMP